jgi:DNA-binding CsgD family transcriptional regulator
MAGIRDEKGTPERPGMEHLLGEAEELAQMGSWALDMRTGVAVWSDGMYRIHGVDPGTPPSMDVLMEHTHPDDRARVRARVDMVLANPMIATEDALTAEYRACRPDGSIRNVRFRGHVTCDDDGEPVRWVGVSQDVTEQRLTERELQARYAVTQTLREWESFDEGVMSLLRRFGTALDFPLGVLWVCDEEQHRITARAFWSSSTVDATDFERETRAISFRSGQGVIGAVWESGAPYFAEDVSTNLRGGRRDPAAQLGLRSALAMAAIGDDGPLAVLSFYAFDRREPSDRLMLTLEGIGEELGHFLARRRAELGSQRLSERELEVLALAAEGYSGPQISERLFVSPATVKTHFEHIYEKLGVGDRAAAVAHAFRTGLIR